MNSQKLKTNSKMKKRCCMKTKKNRKCKNPTQLSFYNNVCYQHKGIYGAALLMLTRRICNRLFTDLYYCLNKYLLPDIYSQKEKCMSYLSNICNIQKNTSNTKNQIKYYKETIIHFANNSFLFRFDNRWKGGYMVTSQSYDKIREVALLKVIDENHIFDVPELLKIFHKLHFNYRNGKDNHWIIINNLSHKLSLMIQRICDYEEL